MTLKTFYTEQSTNQSYCAYLIGDFLLISLEIFELQKK